MNKKLALVAVAVIAVLIAGGIFLLSDSESEKVVTEPKIHTVGILGSNDGSATFLKDALTALGYIEGENIQYVIEPVATTDQYEPAIQALIEAKVDVIISIGTPTTLVASKLTSTIPIVFTGNQGQFVTDLEPLMTQQGAKTNLTGIINTNPSERRFELLMEMIPTIKVVYVPYDPSNPLSVESLGLLESVAKEYDVTITTYEYTDQAGAQQALEELPDDADAIILPTENPMLALIGDWMDLSILRQVPLAVSLGLYNTDTFSFPAVLMGYGSGISDLYKEVIELVDQVLQGIAPADLPVRPSEVYLTISLGAAEALGLEIPNSLLDQANYILREPVALPTEEAPAPTEVATSEGDEAPSPSSEAACNATLVTALGESIICLNRSCDLVEDSGPITYEDKTPVAACSTEGVLGTCSRAIGESYFYSGDMALLEPGCVASGGEWTAPSQ